MITDSSVDLITVLSKLAYQYGPFLFAILFTVFITRWAYGIYQKTCTRTEPKASDREKNTCRIYFLGTAGFSTLLVITAILWWFFNAPVTHKFMGRIEDLKDYQRTVSHSFYLRPSYIHPPDVDLPVTHNDHFVIVRNQPFEKGEVFDISIYTIGLNVGGERTIEKFEIEYLGKDYVVYKLGIDPNDGKAILIPKIAYNSDNSLFSGTAIAQERIWDKKDAVKSVSEYRHPSFEGILRNEAKISEEISKSTSVVQILQKERSSVAEKQNALLELQKKSKNELFATLSLITNVEPMIITLSDLTRHTDGKIAFLAKEIFYKKVDIDEFLLDQMSKGSIREDQAENLFLRIDKEISETTLSKLSQNSQFSWAELLYNKIQSGQIEPKLLIPTGSIKGDRYYVKASWDPRNSNVVNSLTALFHRSLIHNRTFREEKEIMEGRDNRYVYWYSKQWALGIAEDIENAGAKATFVGF